MAVIRVERTKNYTVMANHHLQDRQLSLKAVGLLSKMLSLPEGWDYTVAGLASICKEGKTAIRAALVELEEAGYMRRRQTHGAGGEFSSNEYVIYETPQPAETETQEPLSENPTTVEEQPPLSGFPSAENPLTENRTQLNTKLINHLENNPPIVPPPGDTRSRKKREVKKAPDWKPERFARFWASYPCGKDKQAAIRAWDALKPSDDLLKEMALGLARALQSEEWQRGIGIPYACRWLKNRRWEDETHTPVSPPPPPAHEEPKGAYRL